MPEERPSEKTRLLAAIEKATGPSPWYWETFPTVVGQSRQRFVWTYHGTTGELAFLVTLSLEQEPNRPRLALNTFCVPFVIAPNLLGIWCPEPGGIRVMCFDPDQLAAFAIEEIVGWFKQSNDRVYSSTAPAAYAVRSDADFVTGGKLAFARSSLIHVHRLTGSGSLMK